tara:strand:- start:177 stop:374 length:198 start_codon:yes stop_codon:yes gene_type:complete
MKMNSNHLDEIEAELLEMAIDDPVRFWTWLDGFVAYVENKLEELVENQQSFLIENDEGQIIEEKF